jgi:hypothetical protein
MKRLILTLVAAIVLALAAALPALADAGSPGTTFPEQPGTHNQQGCAAIATNPNQFAEHASPMAQAITTGLYTDACLGG